MSERRPPAEVKDLLEGAEVSGLYYYPVKSCGVSSVEVAQLSPTGILHDREFMVIDDETGRFVSQREHPEMARIRPCIEDKVLQLHAPGFDMVEEPIITVSRLRSANIWKDEVMVADQGNRVAEWLSEYLGMKARLVHMASGHVRQVDTAYGARIGDEVAFADGYPFLLTSEESLADLNERLPSAVPM